MRSAARDGRVLDAAQDDAATGVLRRERVTVVVVCLDVPGDEILVRVDGRAVGKGRSGGRKAGRDVVVDRRILDGDLLESGVPGSGQGDAVAEAAGLDAVDLDAAQSRG